MRYTTLRYGSKRRQRTAPLRCRVHRGAQVRSAGGGAPLFFAPGAEWRMDLSAAHARIRIVLARPSHPGNVGAAARAMKTMGFADLRLVAPRRAVDDEARALAAGAADVLASATIVGA